MSQKDSPQAAWAIRGPPQHGQTPSGVCRIQGLYLLLVTNKASNILEDLETLRLLAKVRGCFQTPAPFPGKAFQSNESRNSIHYRALLVHPVLEPRL